MKHSTRLVSEPLAARSWSPAQLMMPVIGGVFVVWGFASLVHSGFHTGHIFEPHDSLLGFRYTPLMGAIEIGFGAAMLLAGSLLRFGRGRMHTIDGLAVGLGSMVATLVSGAALALGLTVVAGGWTAELRHWLGAGRPEAWVYVTVGAVGLLSTLTSPMVLAPVATPTADASEPGDPTESEPEATASAEGESDGGSAAEPGEAAGRTGVTAGAERRDFTVG